MFKGPPLKQIKPTFLEGKSPSQSFTIFTISNGAIYKMFDAYRDYL